MKLGENVCLLFVNNVKSVEPLSSPFHRILDFLFYKRELTLFVFQFSGGGPLMINAFQFMSICLVYLKIALHGRYHRRYDFTLIRSIP